MQIARRQRLEAYGVEEVSGFLRVLGDVTLWHQLVVVILAEILGLVRLVHEADVVRTC